MPNTPNFFKFWKLAPTDLLKDLSCFHPLWLCTWSLFCLHSFNHTYQDGFFPTRLYSTSQFSLQVSEDLSASQSISHVPPLEIKFSSSFLLCERNQPISHFPWHNPISPLLLLSSCQVFPTSSSCVFLYLANYQVNAALEPDDFIMNWQNQRLVIYRSGMEMWEC